MCLWATNASLLDKRTVIEQTAEIDYRRINKYITLVKRAKQRQSFKAAASAQRHISLASGKGAVPYINHNILKRKPLALMYGQCPRQFYGKLGERPELLFAAALDAVGEGDVERAFDLFVEASDYRDEWHNPAVRRLIRRKLSELGGFSRRMVNAHASFTGNWVNDPSSFSITLRFLSSYSYLMLCHTESSTLWHSPESSSTMSLSFCASYTRPIVPFTHRLSGSFFINTTCAPTFRTSSIDVGSELETSANPLAASRCFLSVTYFSLNR